MEKLEKLFEPIKIGTVEIKNRIAYAPTHMSHCTDEGFVTDQVLCFYAARAKGGTGLIIVEVALPLDKYGRSLRRVLGCYDDSHLAGLKALAEVIKAKGSVGIVQVTLGFGSQALYSVNNKEIIGPSHIPTIISKGSAPKGLQFMEGMVGKTPRPLTTEEIVELEDAFVAGVERVQKAGFAGIEIHGPHGYLIGQFLSPYSNKRDDSYGGSFEKRLTLALNLLKKSRDKVGPDFLIGFRISADEHIEGGYHLDEGKKIAQAIEQAGADFLHISSGRYEAFKYTLPDSEGTMLEESQAIKEAINIPVICPNIHNPITGENAILNGMADIISLSRGLIADPEWANKAKAGKIDDINRCIFCGMCLKELMQGFMVKCAVNRQVGWERFFPENNPFLPT
jgi:2,4-dienoyl-CoA reductase-like NADH-dependent reductase (Old Yellow Enzyme family)